MTSTPTLRNIFGAQGVNNRSLVQAKFQNLHLVLVRKEDEILSRMNEFTFRHRLSVESALNQLSDISLDIENKFDELDDIMLNSKIVEILAQDFSIDILKPLDEKLNDLNTKIGKEASEFTAIVDQVVLDDNRLEELASNELLNQHFLLNFTNILEKQSANDIQITNVELNITKDLANSKILVQASPTKRSYAFTQDELSQIREIHYQFRLEDQNMNYSSLYARYLLPKILTNVTSIFVYITNFNPSLQQGNYSGYFHFMFYAIFSHPQNLQNIHIEANQLMIGDLGPTFIVEKVLPQAKNLKSFSLILPHCGVGTLSIKALANADLTNLERFKLFLAGINGSEEDVIELFNKIPNIRDLAIAIADTPIRNQTLEVFSTKILPSLNKLEKIEVGFWNTLLNDEAVHIFLMNLPNGIKNLVVGIEATNTTDAGLLEFLDAKIPLLSNLQQLLFYTSKTNISDEVSERIQQINEQINFERHAPSQ